MKIEIGACEARIRLPELLRQVKAGKRYFAGVRYQANASLRG